MQQIWQLNVLINKPAVDNIRITHLRKQNTIKRDCKIHLNGTQQKSRVRIEGLFVHHVPPSTQNHQREKVCSNVVSFVKAAGSCRTCSRVNHSAGWTVPVVDLLWGAAAAQNAPSNEHKGSGRPSQIQRCTYLPFLRLDDDRIVEIPDNTVSGPAHGDQKQNGSANEGDASGDHNSGFDALLLHASSALGPHDGEEKSEHSHHDSDDAQSPGRLQVRAEGQHGVVDFTLHLSGALYHTVHPDSLPYGLRCYNVHPDESGDLPHG